MADRPDRFVEGEVIQVDYNFHGAKCYLIKVSRDHWDGQPRLSGHSRLGDEVAVPYEVDLMEYDERLSLVEASLY
jgi:hypothetical protein